MRIMMVGLLSLAMAMANGADAGTAGPGAAELDQSRDAGLGHSNLQVGDLWASTMPAMTEPRLALQLWSVRDSVAADFEGTLRALADMGFAGVEFAGNYDDYADNPAGLVALMDELGLACAGAHVNFAQLAPDALPDTVAFHQAINCPTLIVAMDERAYSADGIDWAIAELNRVAVALQGSGLATGYHNHWQEFAGYGEATFWDALARGTTSDVVLQLDVRHVAYAGYDPVAYLERYPGRTFSSHFKAFVPEGGQGRTIIGDDSLDWIALLEAARRSGGTQWLVVEQEVYPDGLSPMEASQLSLEGLRSRLEGL